jgi:Rod binding domain-containing protein
MSGQVTAASSAPIPPDIRAEGADAVKRYRAALDFEQLLVRQLTSELTQSASVTGDDDDEEGGDAASGLQKEMIPDALAQSITMNGGLGLARSLYGSLGSNP